MLTLLHTYTVLPLIFKSIRCTNSATNDTESITGLFYDTNHQIHESFLPNDWNSYTAEQKKLFVEYYSKILSLKNRGVDVEALLGLLGLSKPTSELVHHSPESIGHSRLTVQRTPTSIQKKQRIYTVITLPTGDHTPAKRKASHIPATKKIRVKRKELEKNREFQPKISAANQKGMFTHYERFKSFIEDKKYMNRFKELFTQCIYKGKSDGIVIDENLTEFFNELISTGKTTKRYTFEYQSSKHSSTESETRISLKEKLIPVRNTLADSLKSCIAHLKEIYPHSVRSKGCFHLFSDENIFEILKDSINKLCDGIEERECEPYPGSETVKSRPSNFICELNDTMLLLANELKRSSLETAKEILSDNQESFFKMPVSRFFWSKFARKQSNPNQKVELMSISMRFNAVHGIARIIKNVICPERGKITQPRDAVLMLAYSFLDFEEVNRFINSATGTVSDDSTLMIVSN